VIEDSPLLSPFDTFRGVSELSARSRRKERKGRTRGERTRRVRVPVRRERLGRSERDARSTIVPIVKTIF